MLGLVQAPAQLIFLFGFERFLVADLAQNRVLGGGPLDRLLPVGDVLLLVNPLAFGADFNPSHRLQPLVLETELDKRARVLRHGGSSAGRVTIAGAREDVYIRVVEVLVVPEEVVDNEPLLGDVGSCASAATAHLLVQDRTSHPSTHHQVQNFSTVESGVQHADAHRNHWVCLGLKLTYENVGLSDVGGDDLGVSTFELGVELVEVLGETRGVVLGDSENDSFARTGVLKRSQLQVASPCEPVELSHHQAVGRLIGETALELCRVVVFIIDVRSLGQDFGDATGEGVGREVVLTEGRLNWVGEVGLTQLALVEIVGIALDVVGRGCSEADVSCIEPREGRLPGAVDGAMALVCDDHVEVARSVFAHPANHSLEQCDRDLLFLTSHSRP